MQKLGEAKTDSCGFRTRLQIGCCRLSGYDASDLRAFVLTPEPG